jgi:hypothetical protein
MRGVEVIYLDEREMAAKPFTRASARIQRAPIRAKCRPRAAYVEQPAFHGAMDVAKELQALWDSRVRFVIECDGSRFVMKVGDYLEGSGSQATASTLEEALAWVSDQARRFAERH